MLLATPYLAEFIFLVMCLEILCILLVKRIGTLSDLTRHVLSHQSHYYTENAYSSLIVIFFSSFPEFNKNFVIDKIKE